MNQTSGKVMGRKLKKTVIIVGIIALILLVSITAMLVEHGSKYGL